MTLPLSTRIANGFTRLAQHLNNLFPKQTGNAGKVLGTDGTKTKWIDINVNGVPEQTVNEQGYILSTNGNTPYWKPTPLGHHIFEIFCSLRTDGASINGAYECDGTFYDYDDFSGDDHPYDLLYKGRAKTVSLEKYEEYLEKFGYCPDFGLDIVNKRFRVPTIQGNNERHLIKSWRDETGWYNIYSDGWLEQGGRIWYSGYGNQTHQKIPFYKEFETTDYVFATTPLWTYTTDAQYFHEWSTVTTGDFNTRTTTEVYVTGAMARNWVCYGYIKDFELIQRQTRYFVQLSSQISEIALSKYTNVLESETERFKNEIALKANSMIPMLEGKVFTGRFIGEIVHSLIPLNVGGLHPLDGSILQYNGIYKKFIDYCVNLSKTYPKLFLAEESWRKTLNDYGSCGKFAFQQEITCPVSLGTLIEVFCSQETDNELQFTPINPDQTPVESHFTIQKTEGLQHNFTVGGTYNFEVILTGGAIEQSDNTHVSEVTINLTDGTNIFTQLYRYSCEVNTLTGIRLPYISNILQNSTFLNEVGEIIEAGLPDPVIDILERWDSTSSGVYTEKYGNDGYTGTKPTNTGGTDEYMQSSLDKARQAYLGVEFTNPMYGRYDTVQPQTVKVLLYICVATSTITDVEININNVASDIVPLRKSYITESYHDEDGNWYRIYSDGWCEQGGKVIVTTDAYQSNQTISFINEYKDTNYYFNISSLRSAGANLYVPSLFNKTTISINYYNLVANSGGATWHACGILKA